jgi:signal transduction histidine kinase
VAVILAPAKADDRQFGAWLLFFAAVAVAASVAILVNPVGAVAGSIVSAALILAMTTMYWFLARPSRAGVRSQSRRAWVYVCLAAPLLIAAIVLNPWANAAMFILSPQIFILFRIRSASVMFIALCLADFVAQVAPGPYTWPAVWPNVLITVGVIVVAIFFNARVSSISEESAAKGALIDELRRTQNEIARMSEEQGRSAERVRIAREMHDTLAQGFTSIVTLGHAVARELEDDPAAARRHVELMTLTAQENLQESRRIIAALSPGQLLGASLAEAIGRVVDRFASQNEVDATATVDGSPIPVPASVDVVLLRVCQESLSNVAKHAGARVVTVELRYDADAVTLTVRDDGAGFDVDARSDGYGVEGMRSRVREVGGEVSVSSARGHGTTIRARIPLSDDTRETDDNPESDGRPVTRGENR